MAAGVPNSAIAADLAAAAVGRRPIGLHRFGTGSQHYVFEATFEDRAPVVVRIAAEHGRAAMAGALKLSRLLRPRGVPLPRVIAEHLDHPFSHLVLERLPGTDLGDVISGLSDFSLQAIAAEIARAQQIVARTMPATRYGYGVTPADAPHARWSRVIEDSLDRSRRRIATAGLFDPGVVDMVATLMSAVRPALDALPPTAFLHDTTTKNVIVTPQGAFSGIVDVDDLCFGDPRYVVALTLAALRAHGRPTGYVDTWMNAAGLRADRIFRLYVALFIVDFMSEHGQAFNENLPPSSRDARDRLLGVFAEQLRLVEA